MTSIYPKARDTLRRINAPADEVHAQLFHDLFDSIVAVEQELGVNPSGPWGSLFGRMFASELVSKTCGYWRKLHLAFNPAVEANLRGSVDFPTIEAWPTGRMDGTNTVMGDNTPFVFTVYNGRGPGSSFFDPAGGGVRVWGQPWYCFPYIVQKTRAYIAAVSADLAATNQSASTVQVGVIAWGMQPSAVQSFQQE